MNSELHIPAMDAFLQQSLPTPYYDSLLKKISSSSVFQSKILESFLARKDFFTTVRIQRKPKKVSIKFSIIPNYKFEDVDFTKTNSADNLEPDILKADNFESVSDSKPLESEPTLSTEKKRKGRGKGKKQTPPRSVINVLIDDSDIEKLNNLAITQDLTVSYLIRAAVRQYLNFEH